MPEQLTITVGANAPFKLQCKNRGALSAPQFLMTDGLSAYVYQGQDQAALFGASVQWYTAGGTQTGYDQAQIQVTIAAEQSATLVPGGEYEFLVWRTPQGTTEPQCVWRGDLLAKSAAGSGIQSIQPYCQLADMLRYAGWIGNIQNPDTDQQGFYLQRLQAREWLDNLIVKNYRGGAWAAFGDAARPAATWSGWSSWRSSLPSPWLQQQLAGGFVVGSKITLASPGTGYTSAPIVTVPPPPSGPLNNPASFYAQLNGTGGVGSVVLTVPGAGYTPGSTLALTFTGGGGTGAAATAAVSNGALMIRPHVARLCAYKAISLVAWGQIGINNQYASSAQSFDDLASEELQSLVAELDANGDGLADFVVPMQTTNTIYV
jgi:hypothetical protein